MENLPFDVLTLTPLLAAAVGAFFGGIVAFLVSQMNERIKRHRKRWFEHRNSIPQLERMLNEVLDTTGANMHTAETVIDLAPGNETRLPIVWSELHPLPFDPTLQTNLLRIELINELFSFGVKKRRQNADTEVLCRAYSDMRDGLLRHDLNRDQYLASLAEFQQGLRVLMKGYRLMDERTLTLLARLRVSLYKDKTHDERGWSFYWMPKLEVVSKDEVKEERGILDKEIAETQSRSRDEIKKHLG